MKNEPVSVQQHSSSDNHQYAWRTAFLLAVGYMLSFVDRQMVAVLIEPIQADLGITDTQFGLLHGLAFAMFFAIAGLPMGWLCDRISRPKLIAAGMAVWSLSTAACGLADSFSSLFIARIGVGVGEAALAPCAYSLLADMFSKRSLGRAIGIFTMGSQFGVALAFFSSSILIAVLGSSMLFQHSDFHPWQMVFIVVGLAGLPLAVIVLIFIPEPRKSMVAVELAGNGFFEQAFKVPIRGLLQEWRVFVPLIFGFSFFAMSTFGFMAWMPAYFVRVLGYSQSSMGIAAGSMVLLLCPAGLLAAGWIVDCFDKLGFKDAAMRAGILGAFLTLISVVLFSILTGSAAYIALAVMLFLIPFPMVAGSVALQLASPKEMRGRNSAIFLLVVALTSQTLGPLNVALVNDWYFSGSDELRLSISLACSVPIVLAIIIINLGLKPYVQRLKDLKLNTE